MSKGKNAKPEAVKGLNIIKGGSVAINTQRCVLVAFLFNKKQILLRFRREQKLKERRKKTVKKEQKKRLSVSCYL